MNAIGHDLRTLIGVENRGLSQKIINLIPDYVVALLASSPQSSWSSSISDIIRFVILRPIATVQSSAARAKFLWGDWKAGQEWLRGGRSCHWHYR